MRIETPKWDHDRFLPIATKPAKPTNKRWVTAASILAALLLFVLALKSYKSHTASNEESFVYPLNMSMVDKDLPNALLNRLILTAEECDTLFPDHALAAERTAKWYSKRGGITRKLADEAADDTNARIVVKSGRLHIDKYRFGYQSRVMAVIQSLYSAVCLAPSNSISQK
jgi:hypothetical protein